jgi:hypothetical protein
VVKKAASALLWNSARVFSEKIESGGVCVSQNALRTNCTYKVATTYDLFIKEPQAMAILNAGK